MNNVQQIEYEIIATLEDGTQVSIPLQEHWAREQWALKEDSTQTIGLVLNSITNSVALQEEIKAAFIRDCGPLKKEKLEGFFLAEAVCPKDFYSWCYQNGYFNLLSHNLRNWIYDTQAITQPTNMPPTKSDAVQVVEGTTNMSRNEIFKLWAISLKMYEAGTTRVNDARAKRVRTLMHHIDKKAAIAEDIELPPYRAADITQAREKDVPFFINRYHLPPLPEKKP